MIESELELVGETILDNSLSDYNILENKPKINDVLVKGELSLDDLGIQPKGEYVSAEALPTKLSELENDVGYITVTPDEFVTEEELNAKGFLTAVPEEYVTHTEMESQGYLKSFNEIDPQFNASPSAKITEEDISNWNNKSEFSGDYNDLQNKPADPVIPTKVSELENDSAFITKDEVDLSNYYDKTSTDELLNAKANASDIPDVSNFVTGEQVDAKIEAIPVSDLLHYKGHVSSVESLPSTGQVTGTAVATQYNNSSVTFSNFKTNNPLHIYNPTASNRLGILKANGAYWIQQIWVTADGPDKDGSNLGFGFATDYPDMITVSLGRCNYQSTVKSILMYTIEYDPNKPVYYVGYVPTSVIGQTASQRMYMGGRGAQLNTPFRIPETMVVFEEIDDYSTPTGNWESTKFWLRGNLPGLKFRSFDNLPFTVSGTDYNYYYEGVGYNSINVTDLKGGYYCYNHGMYLFKFDSNNVARFMFNESLAKTNDLYTVGEYNDLYRCDSTPKWIPVNQRVEIDTYSKSEIDAMFSEAEAALDEIIEGGA